MKGDFEKFWLSLAGGLLGVLLGLVFGWMSMYFYVARHTVHAQKPNVENVDTTLLNSQNPVQTKDGVIVISDLENGIEKKAKVGVDFYLCEITDFYESMITTLFSTIGIILIIGFVYVYNASKKQADDMARSALSEESFKIKLKDQINKIVDEKTKTEVAKLSSENNIPEIAELYQDNILYQYNLDDITKRIDFLDKTMTDFSYKTTNKIISEEPLEEKS